MNTVLKGDTFEQNSYALIMNSIENDEFGISPKFSKVFRKKGYYSNLRQKDIIFDLSIEIWPPNAGRYSILYLVECKDYSTKKVPVGDIENFLYKIREINNNIENDAKGIKGVFISNNSFQEGAIEIAKKTGLMLIEVNSNNELSIKLYKVNRNQFSSDSNEAEKEIETFLYNVFDLTKVQGLKKHNRKTLEDISNDLLDRVDKYVLKCVVKTQIEKTILFLKSEYKLNFDFDNQIEIKNGKNILGYFDVANNIIKIDNRVVNTDRFSFLLAHEIGHFILHRDLKINQQAYDNFQDSEYNYLSDKYLLNNYKNWIEWQANEFASSFIMPSNTFYNRLLHIQEYLGITRRGYIYLDDQPINRRDFGDITKYLAEYFNTTYTSVIYKLESLDLITYDRKVDGYKSELRYRIIDSGKMY